MTQFALVKDGALIRVENHKAAPSEECASGYRYLPVENRDSVPFDKAKHWRLAPSLKVEANRVVRIYPVVAKSLEHA